LADIKVSGLSLAASFLTTHELPVNEAGTSKKVTGTLIKASVAQGLLLSGFAQVTANQTGWTAVVDVTSLTVTVTPAVAGRRFRITVFIQAVSSTVTTDTLIVTIVKDGTTIGQANATNGNHLHCVAVDQPTLAAHTYKAQIQRVGTGTGTLSASGTGPAFISVEDIGPN